MTNSSQSLVTTRTSRPRRYGHARTLTSCSRLSFSLLPPSPHHQPHHPHSLHCCSWPRLLLSTAGASLASPRHSSLATASSTTQGTSRQPWTASPSLLAASCPRSSLRFVACVSVCVCVRVVVFIVAHQSTTAPFIPLPLDHTRTHTHTRLLTTVCAQGLAALVLDVKVTPSNSNNKRGGWM